MAINPRKVGKFVVSTLWWGPRSFHYLRSAKFGPLSQTQCTPIGTNTKKGTLIEAGVVDSS